MRANEIAAMLANQAENVAAYLLPSGKREGPEWVTGNIHGDAGKSLKVCIAGSKQGVWKDFSEGSGGDLLTLWAETRNIGIGEAIQEAKKYLGIQPTKIERDEPLPKVKVEGGSPTGSVMAWLKTRGISEATAKRYMITENGNEIGFPYYVENNVVFCKYRNILDKKRMHCEKGGKAVLFGWQAIPQKQRSVIITEGEMDALAWFEMGYPCLSVPNGATGIDWIEREYNRLERFDKIYIAFDADQPGRAGALPLLERLGAERCVLIDTGKHKDGNELLLSGDSPKPYIEGATWQDPAELKDAYTYRDEVKNAFRNGEDTDHGFNTPWKKLDPYVRFRVNELTIINGVNGHGKSQLVGQFVLNALYQDWKTVIYSGEMLPRRLLTRMTRQATADNEPSNQKIDACFDWLKGGLFTFDLTGSAKADRLLEVFTYAYKRYGTTTFVIDSLLKCGIGEDDYNGQKMFVEKICDFKNKYPVHVFLVTHARKGSDEDHPTGKMDIKGSGSITDLADTVLTIWRNKPKEKAKHENDGVLPEDKKHDPDALLIVSKQRNGDWERSAKLWWHWKSNQFMGDEMGMAKPYFHKLRAV